MRVCFIKCELFETTADVSDNSYISLILKFYVWKSWNITSYHKCFMNHFWGLDLDEHQWRERELWADQKTSGTALVYDERQAVSTLSPVSALCNFEACAFFFFPFNMPTSQSGADCYRTVQVVYRPSRCFPWPKIHICETLIWGEVTAGGTGQCWRRFEEDIRKEEGNWTGFKHKPEADSVLGRRSLWYLF